MCPKPLRPNSTRDHEISEESVTFSREFFLQPCSDWFSHVIHISIVNGKIRSCNPKNEIHPIQKITVYGGFNDTSKPKPLKNDDIRLT